MDRLSRINLDALQSFSVFAESMNFSTAARLLHISQPALHVKIRKLGEQLDLPLYQRSGRKLELTAHGDAVARYGRDLHARTEGFLQVLHKGAEDQPVVMAAGSGAYQYLLGPALQRFLAKASVPVRLLTLDRAGAVEAVRSGKAQIAVAPLETVPSDMQAHALSTVGQVLVVPRGHPLARRRSVRLSDLAGSKIVVPPAGAAHRDMLAHMLQSAGVEWEVAVEASGWELMLQFVSLGVGVAVVNACCNIPRTLVALPLAQLPAMRFYTFYRKGLALEGELARLHSLLLAHGNHWQGATRK
ncbi:LysR family transcriptional regulator [Massilia sp. CF038]|uniref:LysR family transcriptional regulator n=1 Tax=Massilia sp. CF038 TaxID=1881045 RepID=UPI000914CAFC|nr:LysR family transcriptional regulator [Massilia sp. CF038]SHH54532.1 DNA-binding transcriptional regulator, LysR family [Massilia sp. CF038]